jgi:hypothetical protein
MLGFGKDMNGTTKHESHISLPSNEEWNIESTQALDVLVGGHDGSQSSKSGCADLRGLIQQGYAQAESMTSAIITVTAYNLALYY